MKEGVLSSALIFRDGLTQSAATSLLVLVEANVAVADLTKLRSHGREWTGVEKSAERLRFEDSTGDRPKDAVPAQAIAFEEPRRSTAVRVVIVFYCV